MRYILSYILWGISKLVLLRHQPFVILITGAVGKTTTKDAIWTVLSKEGRGVVRRSEKNLNTEIGLPLAILDIAPAGRSIQGWGKNILKGIGVLFASRYPDTLVLEAAADKPGDIAHLVSIARPDIAVVTAIGEMPSHLEFFTSRDQYIEEKARLLQALKPDGVAVLNGDDADVWAMRSYVPEGRQVFRYGTDERAEVRATDIEMYAPRDAASLDMASVTFTLRYQEGAVPFVIRGVLGEGMVYAVLAATAVGVLRGIHLIRIREALLAFTPPSGRMTLRTGARDTIIIDDAYNASPLATHAALKTLRQFSGRRTVAVLGDMKELGENEVRAHKHIGEMAVESADVVVFVGPCMRDAFAHTVANGASEEEEVFWYKTAHAAAKEISSIIKNGDVVLVKGSFSMNMKRVVSALQR